MSALIEEAVAPHRHFGVSIEVKLPSDQPDVPAGARNPAIRYGLGNLIENAVDYAESRVALTATWNESNVTVSIVDDRPGFSPAVFDQLGEPYVRAHSTKKLLGGERSGLGLGFFIAKTLLERSGASLEFENREAPESGAIVRVTWTRTAFEQGHDDRQ